MKLLYVEDNNQDIDLTRRILARQAPQIELETAGTLAEARRLLAGQPKYDLVLLDLRLPDGGGLELLAEIRDQDLPLPVVILTGSGDEETAVAALKAGADDYLIKQTGYLERLAEVLETAVSRFHDLSARRAHPLRVLYVEHNNADIDLARRFMTRHAPHIRLDVAHTIPELLQKLPDSPGKACACDVLLLDYRLPGLNALEALKIIREERQLDVPIVLITGQGNEEVAATALRLGATDYLVKHDRYLHELPAVLENAHHQAQMAREQRALAESEARFRRLADNARDIIFRICLFPERKIEYISPAVIRLTGYTPEEFMANPMLAAKVVNQENDYSQLLTLSRDQGDLESLVPIRVAHKDGRILWLEINPVFVRDENGRLVALEGVARDITAVKEAEFERNQLLAQVQEQVQRVQQIIETVPEGVLLLDADGRVILANPVAEKDLVFLAGQDDDRRIHTLGGRPLTEFLAEPPPGLWHELSYNGRAYELIARPVGNAQKAAQWVMVIQDVTKEHAHRQYQQVQERLATVGQLAAGISHDFNNVMSVITLYAQILQETADLSADDQAKLLTILSQAEHAAALIEQIMDFSRRSVMDMAPLNLVPLVKEMVKLLKQIFPETITVSLSFQPDDYIVMADPTRLKQVLMNLALNARDAMPEGGEITLSLSRLELSAHEPLPLPDMTGGQWVVIQVSDTGVGISAADQVHLFEPFFTTKEAGQGTGLGLAQVHGIVKQHNGYIGVQSQVGQGSSFSIYLPFFVQLQEDTAVSRPSASQPVEKGTETILVVEDNEAMRSSVADVLAMLGYHVLEAAHGREAVALLEETETAVSLVVTDFVMPEMDGLETFLAVKTRFPEVQCLLMTGYPFGQDEEKLRQAGINQWLLKPFKMSTLAAKVRHMLDQPAG